MYKKYFENKKAILFDLDGTLVNTENFWLRTFDNVVAAKPLESLTGKDVYKKGCHSCTRWAEIVKTHNIQGVTTPQELEDETHKEFLNVLNEVGELEVTEGFWPLIHELKVEKELKTGLVTNTEKALAERVLESADLMGLFDIYLFGDDVKKPKPNAEIYIKAAKELEVKPQEVLVFEDSRIGVEAAVKAGMDVIVIWDSETDKLLFPEEVLDFMPTFQGLAGNLDLTYQEAIAKAAKEVEERKLNLNP
jgi:HAD superfamily hydrolase (TIGR01509 family)